MRRWMGMVFPMVLAVAAGLAFGDTQTPDWRLELLKEEGISPDLAKLREFQEGISLSRERVVTAVKKLGAHEFKVRETAQRDLVLMGNKVLPLLRELPRSEDPEVRERLHEIRNSLLSNGRWTRDELVRQAVDSLLRERRGEGNRVASVFAEFFKQAQPSLVGGYRRFKFKADGKLGGLVSDGMLRMPGKHPDGGDQSLFLTSKELTGKEELPDEFRVEVRLGGEPGGEGSYHIGVSVGKVRALFHPGYPGGGFRFEQTDNHRELTTNTVMGFNPAAGALQRMSVGVRRVAGDKVEFDVKIISADGAKVFVNRKVMAASSVGKLDSIGLDRSGRSGGDALFDDLVVDLGAH